MKKQKKVNVLCEGCIKECKQEKYVTIIKCPMYVPTKGKNEDN